MSKIIRIPDDVAILVCDAQKALIMKNTGAVANANLQISETLTNETEDSDTGFESPPGRRFDGGAAAISGGARSKMEVPDVETKRAEEFAERIVSHIAQRVRSTPIQGIVLAAPPSFLGVLRKKMTDEFRALVRSEIAKEMTENQRLRRAVSDLTLDKLILTEAAKGIPLTGR